MMIGLGIPGAALIGAGAYYFIIYAAPPLFKVALWFLPTTDYSPFKGLIGILTTCLGIPLGFLVVVGCPLAPGGGIGLTTSGLARSGKCRDARVVLMATILNTGVGLSIIVLLDATTGDGNLSSGFGFPVYRAFAPLFIAGSLLMAWGHAITTPFCEKCEQWYYTSWGSVEVEAADVILNSLTSSTTQLSGTLREATGLPHLEVVLQRCPICNTSDFGLKATLVWKEGSDEKRDLWLDTMVPASLGVELEDNLSWFRAM